MSPHVVLVGLMGSGKTSVGRLVAERLGRPYIDNDHELEAATGQNARTIAEDAGLDALHRAERDVLARQLAYPEPAVLGAAASTIDDATIRAALRAHFVVWLDRDIETLVAKAGVDTAGGEHRPDIGDDVRSALERQYAERAPRFRAVAALVLPRTPEDEPDELAARIVHAFRTAGVDAVEDHGAEPGDAPVRQ